MTTPTTVHPSGHKVPEHLSTARPAASREEKIDRQMEDSFPASDPPSFSGGNHIIGAPVSRESDAATGSDPQVMKRRKRKSMTARPKRRTNTRCHPRRAMCEAQSEGRGSRSEIKGWCGLSNS